MARVLYNPFVLLITTTHRPATDLGYLLHKHPGRNYQANASFGSIYVVFPEASEERATAALLVNMDPISLVRGKNEAQGSVGQFVNDRPYVASSFLSVAISEAYSTAMNGRSQERQELADQAIPLEIRIPVLPCRGGEALIRRLFEPLQYEVQTAQLPLDPEFPEWGSGAYFDVTLKATIRLSDALRHLYLLFPVLDARKHYYMDATEVEKLLSKGEGWLANHPEKEWIVRASLGRKPSLMRRALEQLANVEESLVKEDETVDEVYSGPDESTEVIEAPKPSLHRQRHDRIEAIIRELKPRSVIDLGCGEGKLIRQLIKIQGLDRIVGMDVSYYEIEKATRKLHLDNAGPRMKERIQLIHGSLMYRDERLAGFEVCTVIEVIEHLDPPRLAAFERVVFQHARPRTILLTTPNREYNAVYDLEVLRHSDHRFEWTRKEFEAWGNRVAEIYGYAVRFEGIGDANEELGAPSQLAVFTL